MMIEVKGRHHEDLAQYGILGVVEVPDDTLGFLAWMASTGHRFDATMPHQEHEEVGRDRPDLILLFAHNEYD